MANRQTWSTFIQGHPDVLRLLSARGDSSLICGIVQDADRIRDFLDKLKDPAKDPVLLYGLIYILRPELLDFVFGPLTQLVNAAARETQRTAETRRGEIRGHVLWSRTLIARASGRVDRGTFEVLSSVRSQDLPQNQLIKLFIYSLHKLIGRLTQEVPSGAIYKQLTLLSGRIARLLRVGWIQDVSSYPRMSAVMRMRAKRSKDVRYSQVARFQEQYEAVFDRPVWTYTLTLVQNAWLEPVSDDDLFELYSVIKVIDVLQQTLGFDPPSEIGLIKRKRNEIASLRRSSDGVLAQLYYDQSPSSVFGSSSTYMQLNEAYLELGGQPRRPDILLRFARYRQSERKLILECKDTGDDGYRRDSVYKALGYLQDFAALWDAEQRPKVIVLLPGKITRLADAFQDWH
jgi:hypothetical protein